MTNPQTPNTKPSTPIGERGRRIQTPIQVLSIVAISVFLSEVLIMFLISAIPSVSSITSTVAGASLHLIVLIPILYFFPYRSMILYINKHKKTEDELLKFRLGIECSDDVFFITDPQGAISYVNTAFEKTYGYCNEEAVGKTPRILKSNLYSEETYTDFWKSLKAKKVVSGEIKNRTRDGRILTIESSANPILDDDEEIIGFLAVQRDISQINRTRQVQEVLFNISNAVLTSMDMKELADIIRKQIGTLIDTTNFNIVFYDKATDKLTAIYNKDEKDEIGTWRAGKSLTGYVIKHKKALLVTKDTFMELYRHEKIDLVGTIAEVWLGVPLIGDDEIIGAFVVQSYEDSKAYDMKDLGMLEFIANQIAISFLRKKAMLDLGAALQKAEESDRLKSAFLATMNHELRTPLNHILGFSELINSAADLEESKDFASTIQASGQDLLSIIEDIFELALVEQFQIKVRRQTFSLMDHFLENRISFEDILRTSGKDEQIRLIFTPDTDLLSLSVNADRSKINKALGNLFKNAVKFTDRGTIEFGCKLADQSMLMFYIKDSGIGIPKEKQAIIFDFFRQGDDSSTRHYGGLGIGLSISLKIARLLSGKLTVESEPGNGSTFWFTVPVEISNPEVMVKYNPDEVNSEFKLEGRNILIVEDDPLSLSLVRSFLGSTGAGILEATGGEEAILMWHDHPEIDLVLMNLKMAGMDGFEATRLIKAENPDLPVIALTGYTLSSDKTEAFEAGCNGIVTKPVNKRHLINEIKKTLS